jgi:hypothetical protein
VLTSVSEELAASIFRAEDEGSKFLHTVGNHNKSKNVITHHNLNLHYQKNHKSQAKNPMKLQLDEIA